MSSDYIHCCEGKPLGDFVPLNKYGKPKAVLDREEKTTTEDEKKS